MSRVNARWLSRVNTARFSEEHGHRAAVAACLLLSLQIISIAKMRDTREMTRDARSRDAASRDEVIQALFERARGSEMPKKLKTARS